MSPAPAASLTVAIALAFSGCAVAPSPAPSQTSSPSPSEATPSADGSPVFVGWETGPGGPHLLVVHAAGRVVRQPLPAVPNGPPAAGLDGPLLFLSGDPARPVLWTGDGSFSGPTWTSQSLLPPAPQEEELRWLCLATGAPPGNVAVQSNDTLVYLVEARGTLRLLPPALLMLRPGGCAWPDTKHVLVPVDRPDLQAPIAFAMLAVDGGPPTILDGSGGENPVVSAVSLAYVAREGERYVVLVGPIPPANGPVAPPEIRLEPDGAAAFFRPVLSADGTRMAVLESDARGRPSRLIVYGLGAEGTVVLELDVRGAADAGPVWVADADAR